MHIALQFTGYGAAILLLLTVFFGIFDARHPGNDGGNAFMMALCGIPAAILGVSWLALVVIKAALA